MRPIEVAKLALLAERSREVAELAHLLAEAAARHAERVEAGDAERRHACGAAAAWAAPSLAALRGATRTFALWTAQAPDSFFIEPIAPHRNGQAPTYEPNRLIARVVVHKESVEDAGCLLCGQRSPHGPAAHAG